MPDPIQQANALIAPTIAEIQRQAAEERKRAENAQATAAVSAQGLSQVLGEIPGRIQATHKTAADSAFEYGKQLGLQFAGGSNAAAADSNAFLAKQGSPQTVTPAGGAGGQVLGGLGGLIPGTELQARGAALASGAEGLGAGALLRGQEQQALIGRDSTSRLAQLDALMRQEKTRLPGLVQDIKRDDRDYGLNLRQDKRAERELRLREKQAREKQLQVFGSDETGYLAFDPRTGRTTRLTDPVPEGVKPPELIGSADTGYYAWDATTGTVTPVLGAAEKSKFTPTQLRAVKKDAARIAYSTFWGVKDEDGKWEDPPLHYQEALAIMLDEQIPLDVAQAALNKWWRKPGAVADIESRKSGKYAGVYWFTDRSTKEDARGRPRKPIQERQAEDAWKQWVGTPEKRTGPSKPHTQRILQFVGQVGMVAGTKLTPWGNESHSVTTVNGKRSAHASGNAADIPASGDELMRLGRAALVAAGMPPAKAAKAPGGIYNIGKYQIIFATSEGGNHYDHVHVGLRS